jgi:hypothetical protein
MHTLAGEVVPLSDQWERLPEMQRLITLDGVIYVHQNPKRRRVAAQAESVETGAYAEPSVAWGVTEPAADWESETSDGLSAEAEVAAVAEVEDGEVAAEVDEQNDAPHVPPPGYAIEFGTGRLVKIHSYKGRMSYPGSDW